jgi:hypothetical protein
VTGRVRSRRAIKFIFDKCSNRSIIKKDSKGTMGIHKIGRIG